MTDITTRTVEVAEHYADLYIHGVPAFKIAWTTINDDDRALFDDQADLHAAIIIVLARPENFERLSEDDKNRIAVAYNIVTMDDNGTQH
jgi:hypothetical protein